MVGCQRLHQGPGVSSSATASCVCACRGPRSQNIFCIARRRPALGSPWDQGSCLGNRQAGPPVRATGFPISYSRLRVAASRPVGSPKASQRRGSGLRRDSDDSRTRESARRWVAQLGKGCSGDRSEECTGRDCCKGLTSSEPCSQAADGTETRRSARTRHCCFPSVMAIAKPPLPTQVLLRYSADGNRAGPQGTRPQQPAQRLKPTRQAHRSRHGAPTRAPRGRVPATRTSRP